MPRFAVIDAPSILGLKPSGVEHLPEALKAAGLLAALGAEYAGRVEPLPFDPRRDPKTLILNPDALKAYSLRLAEGVTGELRQGKFPFVLGGDCSNIIGITNKLGGFWIHLDADVLNDEIMPAVDYAWTAGWNGTS